MKKIKLFSLLLITVFSLSLLTSCGGGGGGGSTPVKDTTPPVITNLTPANNTTIVIGNPIVVTANVADNEELASYKINIHDNFDNHGSHTRGIMDQIPFAATVEGKLSGKTDQIKEVIDLPIYAPDNTSRYQAGEYHVVLTVTDKAGNETVAFSSIKLVSSN